MDSINEDLTNELEEFSIAAEERVIEKMRDLCLSYGFSAEDMVSSWVAYTATKNCNSEPKEELLNQFEQEELMRQNKFVKGKKPVPKNLIQKSMEDLDSPYDVSEQFLQTPERKRAAPSRFFSPNSFSPVQSTPSLKYSSRKASGEVLFKYGHLTVEKWESLSINCSILPFDESICLENRYPYMFEKLRDYASVLNDRIEDMSILFKEYYGVNEWAHIQFPALEPAPIVGRICSETGAKLNAQSLFLEGSQETCSGHILPLDVSSLEEYSFFPGQIISGEGINTSGKTLTLKKLFQNSFMPPFPDKAPSLQDNEMLSFVIVAGPFTTSDSLSYEPLEDFIKYLKLNTPNICIMCGPFVDIKHEEIEKGNLDETYEDIFLGLMKKIVNDLLDSHVKIILVPSQRDAHHDMVYPTPPYNIQQDIESVYLASDPCLLSINNVVFGITSTDILYHLGKEELHCSQNLSDRLGRLSEHLLKQRSFYPLYPPPDDMNIDYIHLEAHCSLLVRPHVLILPSDLKYFIKDVNGCCCINPERLAKGTVGGTFARLKIHSGKAGSLMDNLKAEIIRI